MSLGALEVFLCALPCKCYAGSDLKEDVDFVKRAKKKLRNVTVLGIQKSWYAAVMGALGSASELDFLQTHYSIPLGNCIVEMQITIYM